MLVRVFAQMRRQASPQISAYAARGSLVSGVKDGARVKERPILFQGDMVRAVHADEKTQTRRALNPQPMAWVGVQKLVFIKDPWHPDAFKGTPVEGRFKVKGPRESVWCGEDFSGNIVGVYGRCPYGLVGDRLWVREAFYVQPELWARNHGPQPVHYAADTNREEVEDYVQKPSIHMPRWASRITLEITGVRVERVQEISEEDARAEGIDARPQAAIPWYRDLWDSINADRGYGWAANPLVWVVMFKRLK